MKEFMSGLQAVHPDVGFGMRDKATIVNVDQMVLGEVATIACEVVRDAFAQVRHIVVGMHERAARTGAWVDIPSDGVDGTIVVSIPQVQGEAVLAH